MSRHSKYPDIGIMDAIERLLFGGVPKFNRSQLFEEVSKNKEVNRSLFSKKVYSLKEGGFIEYVDDQEFILTSKGLKRIDFIRLEKLSLKKRKKDGSRRLIIFDVPEKKRGARELLRGKLIEFSCYQLQKSVYVTSYICEKEIGEVCKILGIADCVHVIVTKSIGEKESRNKENKNKGYFNKN